MPPVCARHPSTPRIPLPQPQLRRLLGRSLRPLKLSQLQLLRQPLRRLLGGSSLLEGHLIALAKASSPSMMTMVSSPHLLRRLANGNAASDDDDDFAA